MQRIGTVKILDCTLRDGGFYNNWDFNDDLILNYLDSINESGVDVVEIGYRSTLSNEFYGLLKYSDDKQLEFLKEFKKVEFSLMIDLKEFVKNRVFERELFTRTLRKTDRSCISWIRVAIVYDLLPYCKEAVAILKGLGYKATINLMQASLLNDEQISKVARTFSKEMLDVIYLADSFGSMLPDDVKKYLTIVKENFDGCIGFHSHDNLSLAFSNCLTAIDLGVDYVDSTILGIGRGAGNLKTEQILLYLKVNQGLKRYNPHSILDFIDRHLKGLKQKYQWGSNFAYALAGLRNIHPMYCQQLEQLGRYTAEKFIQILENIPEEKKTRYSKEELELAIVKAQEIDSETNDIPNSDLFKIFAQDRTVEEVLVIGTGPSAKKYAKAIQQYVDLASPFVIECNLSSNIKYKKGFATLIHEKHLLEAKQKRIDKPVIFGNTRAYNVGDLCSAKYFFKYKVTPKQFKVSDSEICIPSEVVSMYALGLCILLDAKRIILVGFDGYGDSLDSASNYIKQQEMLEFLILFTEQIRTLRIQFSSATPTSYTIPQTSIYYLLNKEFDGQ